MIDTTLSLISTGLLFALFTKVLYTDVNTIQKILKELKICVVGMCKCPDK